MLFKIINFHRSTHAQIDDMVCSGQICPNKSKGLGNCNVQLASCLFFFFMSELCITDF